MLGHEEARRIGLRPSSPPPPPPPPEANSAAMGESLLRSQVQTLLQKLRSKSFYDHADSRINNNSTSFLHHLSRAVFLSPAILAAPTPLNTPEARVPILPLPTSIMPSPYSCYREVYHSCYESHDSSHEMSTASGAVSCNNLKDISIPESELCLIPMEKQVKSLLSFMPGKKDGKP